MLTAIGLRRERARYRHTGEGRCPDASKQCLDPDLRRDDGQGTRSSVGMTAGANGVDDHCAALMETSQSSLRDSPHDSSKASAGLARANDRDHKNACERSYSLERDDIVRANGRERSRSYRRPHEASR